MIRIGMAIVLLAMGCRHVKEAPESATAAWNQRAEKGVADLLGQQIILPETKDVDVISKDENLTVSDLYRSPLKVASFIDATCGACLLDFAFWTEFEKELRSRNLQCDVFIFVSAPDLEATRKLVKEMNFALPVIYDSARLFISKNGIDDKRLYGVLLDENNKINLIGSPVLNETLRELYLQTILDLESGDR